LSVLNEIVAGTRLQVAARREARPLVELIMASEARVQDGDLRSFDGALARPGIAVIAEHKRRSPSAGLIRDGVPLAEVVGAYERAGAAALSVLTESSRFGGNLADLRAARNASALPILRKDFIVDPYQVHESLADGADAILLIVAALSFEELRSLHDLAGELGLDAVIEVHDADEMARAIEIGARIIGINNRDLATLEVDTARALELYPSVPSDALAVAESGYRERAQLDQLQAAGVDAVLIGETLMRAPDIEAACRELTGR
jgi:indole-3-glycerol phosphate synthase